MLLILRALLLQPLFFAVCASFQVLADIRHLVPQGPGALLFAMSGVRSGGVCAFLLFFPTALQQGLLLLLLLRQPF